MLQARGESRIARRRPATRPNVRRLIGQILRVVVHPQMIQPRRHIIREARRPFPRTLRPHVPRHPSPGTEDAGRRALLEDLVDGLVLEEADPSFRVVVEVEEFLVDEGSRGVRDVVVGGGKGYKVLGGGMADAVEGGGAGVRGVGGCVVARGPEDVELRGGVVPDGGGSPEHAGCCCFDAVMYMVSLVFW